MASENTQNRNHSEESWQDVTFNFAGWWVPVEGEVITGLVMKRAMRERPDGSAGHSYMIKLTSNATVRLPNTEENIVGTPGMLVCFDERKALEALAPHAKWSGRYEVRLTVGKEVKSRNTGRKFRDVTVQVREVNPKAPENLELPAAPHGDIPF